MIDFTESTTLKEQLDSLRPLTEININRLKQDERIEMIYASNALEGNTLNVSETQWILEKGMTVDGKSMREHLEVVNLNEAIATAFLIFLCGCPSKNLTKIYSSNVLALGLIAIGNFFCFGMHENNCKCLHFILKYSMIFYNSLNLDTSRLALIIG